MTDALTDFRPTDRSMPAQQGTGRASEAAVISAPLPETLPPGPKGAQLQEALEAHVLALEPGTPLPSEREIAERYGIARMTVKKEFDRLVQRGLVYRHPRRGTFVAEPSFAHTQHVTSFTEVMRARGKVAGSSSIEIDVVPATESTAIRMQVPVHTKILRIRRVRTADGEPVALEESRLVFDRFPGLGDEELREGSLYEILERKYDVHISKAVHRLRAVLLDAKEAEQLGSAPGRPAFRAESVARDEAGAVVEYVTNTYRGDRYEALIEARR